MYQNFFVILQRILNCKAPTGLGAMIDGVYFIVDTSVLIVTGSTIGEKLDARYGSYSLNF